MKRPDAAQMARLSLSFNLAYALYNAVLGFSAHSWWFITLCFYYAVLGSMRFCVLCMKEETACGVQRLIGAGFMALALGLIGVLILCAVRDQGVKYHEIAMIAIALYTFIKLGVAIAGQVRAARFPSAAVRILRSLSLADALASIASLQRSMLVSFEGMSGSAIRVFNLCTGGAVCLCVFLLGLNMIGGKRIDMAKSKLVQIHQKISNGVTDGYKKIEEGVVDGFKKIEEGVVKGYAKVEDAFVERYLTRENETVEEAKERLKQSK